MDAIGNGYDLSISISDHHNRVVTYPSLDLISKSLLDLTETAVHLV